MNKLVVVSLVVAILTFSLVVTSATTPAWMTGSDSISQVLLQTDGSAVQLGGVTVDKICARQSPAYFVVKGAFDPESKIVILCRPPSVLRQGQSVYVEGTISTLPNGDRRITSPTVYGYFNADGSLVRWIPVFPAMPAYNKQPLSLPITPIPSSDPSLPPTGEGISADVSIAAPESATSFQSVSSLVAASPSISTPIELSCRPVSSVGDGFIIIGDDNSDSTLKVFTGTPVKLKDRIIKLTGTVHTENGTIVIYADSGPSTYFDPQGFVGRIFAASPGTVAYAATLKDASAAAESGRTGVLSTTPRDTTDGNWVYMTGQVITATGSYYSYDLDDWVPTYNIQGIDSTPGIRVWDTSGGATYWPGMIVDVMAKLDTRDGERLLGEVDNSWPYDYSSVECTLLDNSAWQYPMVRRAGTRNKALGGSAWGSDGNGGFYNPGITGALGLYNIGSLVTIWGKILECGTYQFDANGYYTKYYMRIDDGSAVPSANSNPSYGGPYGDPPVGVIVFGDDLPSWISNFVPGTYVSVTGPSSVWKPDGSSSTYRAIWLSKYAQDVSSVSAAANTGSGTMSGTITLYDMPTASADVKLFSTCGRMETITVTRGTGNVGTASYSWTGVPTTDPQSRPVSYLVSAKCDGYKTRTYTNVTPGTPKNLYLTPLRKMYLTTDSGRMLVDCTTGPLNINATILDDAHAPVVYPAAGGTVKFTTTCGSFNATTLQQTITANTNASGVATATLYGLHWTGNATIRATDDLTTPDYPDTSDDTYRCDWETLSYTPALYPAQVDWLVSSNPYPIKRCGSSSSAITADVQVCGSAPPAGTTVRFTMPVDDPAVFVTESGVTVSQDGKTATKGTTTVGGYGRAVVHATADSAHGIGVAVITTDLPDYSDSYTAYTTVQVLEHNTNVAISPSPAEITGTGNSTITFTATDAQTGSYVNNLALTIRTTAGDFGSGQTQISRTTNSNGTATATLHMTSAPSAYVSVSYNDGCAGTGYAGTVVVYRQPRWNSITSGVNFSSPLVDDLIPGDGKEVAAITNDDGKLHVWNSNGSLAWTSKDASGNDLTIDIFGDNTLSAANVPGVGTVITAPGGAISWESAWPRMFEFAYDTTFRPLAGWPAPTAYWFSRSASAIGDANLDGIQEIVAGDFSCYVFGWNPTGNWSTSSSSELWMQLTGAFDTEIYNSSAALGDVNSFVDTDRMPDVLIGSFYEQSEFFAFPGDEWGHPIMGYHYTEEWDPYDTDAMIESSPAIGLIDSDSENDVAVCDDGGRLYLWLSSTRSWSRYRLTANHDLNGAIMSSPAIVTLDNQRCVVVGSNTGNVYAVKSDGTPITGWPSDGITLDSSPRSDSKVMSSPIVGDVMNTGTPQVIVGTTNGDVYVLWSDGNNHTGGAVAKVWTCAQTDGIAVNSTPSICSLNGTTVSLIAGSQDGMYKMDLYSGTFVANSSRWPWPTFHRDNARTGCSTSPASAVCASISGKVTLNNNPVPGARVSIRSTGGQAVGIYGRSQALRTDPVLAVGDATTGNEINEGGYCINQLPPNATYQITATDQNGEHQYQENVSVTTGRLPLNITLP